jgi:hypothetical protein
VLDTGEAEAVAGLALAAVGLAAGEDAGTGVGVGVETAFTAAAGAGAAFGAGVAATLPPVAFVSITNRGFPTLTSSPSSEKSSINCPSSGLLTSTLTYHSIVIVKFN